MPGLLVIASAPLFTSCATRPKVDRNRDWSALIGNYSYARLLPNSAAHTSQVSKAMVRVSPSGSFIAARNSPSASGPARELSDRTAPSVLAQAQLFLRHRTV